MKVYIILLDILLDIYFKLLDIFLHKSHIWEKLGSRDMGWNALGQSDCRIFESDISLDKMMK